MSARWLFALVALLSCGKGEGKGEAEPTSAFGKTIEPPGGMAVIRPGMTESKLNSILARQMPDSEKRERADYVVDTSGSLEQTRGQVDAILTCLGLKAGV